ncbi:hypothetical protein H257_05480 [Aphanomyces astaci]|uniref:Uncharacterized protein n=1 Tax=Aphanomyces astaci TaxID=112090 RepID=W4GQF2_APHAT|nr:hypothetical protein H257_05480 [Aphanomyces astaci]ETV81942.1 hypothetical protein H257_05480 [Aphanomyces astaci]|eukprot:XP_009828679.1 hypothetical protein H257_05480 [Aphanomyces astaci]
MGVLKTLNGSTNIHFKRVLPVFNEERGCRAADRGSGCSSPQVTACAAARPGRSQAMERLHEVRLEAGRPPNAFSARPIEMCRSGPPGVGRFGVAREHLGLS